MKLFFILSLLIVFSSCGYSTRGFVYRDDKIYIPPIVSKVTITSEDRRYSNYTSNPVLLEKRLTNILINEFNVYGRLKVVTSGEDALKLICTITGYTKEALRYTESEDIKEQRLRLQVHMRLLDSGGNTIKERDIVGQSSYFLTGANRKTESAAQQELITDTARRIKEAVIEEW